MRRIFALPSMASRPSARTACFSRRNLRLGVQAKEKRKMTGRKVRWNVGDIKKMEKRVMAEF